MSTASANAMAEAYQDSILKIAQTVSKKGPFGSNRILNRWVRKKYTQSTRRLIVERCLAVLVDKGLLMKVGRFYTVPMEKVEIEIPEFMSKSDKRIVVRYGAVTRVDLLARISTPTTATGLLQGPPLPALAACSESSRANFTRALLRWLVATKAARYENGFWCAIKQESENV